MTSDAMHDRDDSAQDAEWAWVADIYREVPAPPPEAIDRAAQMAVALVGKQERRTGKPLRWMVGMAAGMALLLVGRWLIFGARGPSAEDLGLSTPGLSQSSASPTEPPPTSVTTPSHGPEQGGAAAPSRDTMPVPVSASRASRIPVPASPMPALDHGVTPEPGHRDTLAGPLSPIPALPVPAEIAGLDSLARARLHAGLGDTGWQRLTQLIREAGHDHLPIEALLDRAFAGLAHDASPGTILVAVERRAAALRQAHEALGPMASVDALVAGADALDAGAGVRELAQIGHSFPGDRVSTGLLTLVGLMIEGVQAPDAAAALVQGVKAGASDATFLAWRADIAAEVARGVPPRAALRTQVERLGGDDLPGEQRARPQVQVPEPVVPQSPQNLPQGP